MNEQLSEEPIFCGLERSELCSSPWTWEITSSWTCSLHGQEWAVQVSPSHITPIIITRTVRHYQITTGAPLSGLWPGSCLGSVWPYRRFLWSLFTFFCFTFLINFKWHMILGEAVKHESNENQSCKRQNDTNNNLLFGTEYYWCQVHWWPWSL